MTFNFADGSLNYGSSYYLPTTEGYACNPFARHDAGTRATVPNQSQAIGGNRPMVRGQFPSVTGCCHT